MNLELLYREMGRADSRNEFSNTLLKRRIIHYEYKKSQRTRGLCSQK